LNHWTFETSLASPTSWTDEVIARLNGAISVILPDRITAAAPTKDDPSYTHLFPWICWLDRLSVLEPRSGSYLGSSLLPEPHSAGSAPDLWSGNLKPQVSIIPFASTGAFAILHHSAASCCMKGIHESHNIEETSFETGESYSSGSQP
jgi:hypothetical protein